MRIEIVTKFTLFGRRWFWRIVGGNGEKLATSETYSSYAKAEQTAKEVARQAHVGLPVIDVTK